MAPTPQRTLNILITGYGPFMSIDNNPSWLAVKQLRNQVLDLSHLPSLSPTQPSAQSGGGGVTGRIQVLHIPVHYGSVLDLAPRIHGNQVRSSGAQFWHDSRLDPQLGGEEGKSFPDGYDVEVPKEGWDVVIHVGVGRAGALRCETIAHKNGYAKPDAAQQLAPLIPCTENPTIDPQYLDSQQNLRGVYEGYEEFPDPMETQVDVEKLVAWLKERGIKEGEVEQSWDAGRYLCDFIFYVSRAEAERKGKGKRASVIFVHVPPEGKELSIERMTEAISAIAWFMAKEKADELEN